MGAQSRSYLHSVPKVSIFIHYNKLTSRIVSKLLMDLTTLNQALICTPIPNLMGVIQSELMISQAFQACYSIEGCPSNRCVLSHERVGYKIENIHQLNLLPRSPFTHSRESHLQSQELLRWRQGPRAKKALSINLHSEKYIRILQMLETQLRRNRKENSPFYHSLSCLSSMTLPCGYDSRHLPVLRTSRTWLCDPALPPYFTPAHHSLNPKLASFYSEYGLETHDSVS